MKSLLIYTTAQVVAAQLSTSVSKMFPRVPLSGSTLGAALVLYALAGFFALVNVVSLILAATAVDQALFVPATVMSTIIINMITGIIIWQEWRVISLWLAYLAVHAIMVLGIYLMAPDDYITEYRNDKLAEIAENALHIPVHPSREMSSRHTIDHGHRRSRAFTRDRHDSRLDHASCADGGVVHSIDLESLGAAGTAAPGCAALALHCDAQFNRSDGSLRSDMTGSSARSGLSRHAKPPMPSIPSHQRLDTSGLEEAPPGLGEIESMSTEELSSHTERETSTRPGAAWLAKAEDRERIDDGVDVEQSASVSAGKRDSHMSRADAWRETFGNHASRASVRRSSEYATNLARANTRVSGARRAGGGSVAGQL